MIVPKVYHVTSMTHETNDTFTMSLLPKEEAISPHAAGQFNMLTLFGFGEIPLSIASEMHPDQRLIHTIRAVGSVTKAMQKMKVGDEIGVRGPFGSNWPLAENNQHLLLIAGGLGIAPLRPLLMKLASKRNDYKSISLLYGARSPDDLIYKQERDKWQKAGIDVVTSVDRADLNWKGNVGVIPSLIAKHFTSPKNTTVYLCGPEIMMKFSIQELYRLNAPEEKIFLSMERNMKCATGFCGHCLYGPYFICKNGPVFCYTALKELLPIEEL